MQASFQARRVSKPRAIVLRDAAGKGCILLSTFQGTIVIAPKGSRTVEGKVLSTEEASYELQPVWCTESKAKVEEARKRLGLDE
ncbi:MAG: hypothetical protein FJ271_13080 [Planctomycetes bacterium]|nr:hypothetical protein [Planctomycetota bacterium]